MKKSSYKCQAPSASTKCHCADFRNKKAIGDPCICDIYVKVAVK